MTPTKQKACLKRGWCIGVKRRTKIVCGVLLAAIIGVGALTVWQWNNISAALSFTRYSQSELEDRLASNDQTIKDAMDAAPEVVIRDITQEEKDALRAGTLTQEELVQSLLQKPEQTTPEPEQKPQTKPEGEPPPKQVQQPAKDPADSTQPEKKPEQSEYEKQVNALIAQVLVLREEFLIKLDELQAAAIAEYKAIPEDQRTATKLLSFAGGYLAKGLELEKQCDAKVEAIAVELDRLARENGGDPTLAQTVYDTYVEEKSLKKAWYMAELKKRGMV